MSEDREMAFEDMRRMIALNQLVDAQAALHAAMLSELGRIEAAGEPCPGWVALEDRARERIARA